MSDAASLIMIQFLAWVAERPRSYADVMEAWKTSCPRLSVWEDATTEGLVRRQAGPGGRTLICVTARGRALLAETARPATPAARRDSSKIDLNRVRESA